MVLELKKSLMIHDFYTLRTQVKEGEREEEIETETSKLKTGFYFFLMTVSSIWNVNFSVNTYRLSDK